MKNTIKYIIVSAILLICAGYLISRCSVWENFGNDASKAKKSNDEPSVKISADIQKKLDKMSLEEKVYQMFFVTPEQLTGVGEVIQAGETTKTALKAYPVGGIIYSAHNIQTSDQASEMFSKVGEYSQIPLFIGVSEDGSEESPLSGNPDIGISGTTSVNKITDSDEAFENGEKIGEALTKLGINLNFAPSCDIGTIDSFADDKQTVSDNASSFVSGLKKSKLAVVVKHFPGIGDAEGSLEYSALKLDKSKSALKKNEFAPFKEAIDAGADFVMVSPVTAIDIDSEKPAVFSSKVIKEVLRKEIGFNGIVITDNLSCGAVLNMYTSGDAAINAVKAGADMLFMPNSLESAAKSLITAVKNGDISENRINESVARILQCKKDIGLIK